MSIIDDLLAFDDLPELGEFRFAAGGLPAFPAVRWSIYVAALAQALGEEVAHAAHEPLGWRDRLCYAWRALAEQPLVGTRRFDVVMLTSPASLLQRGGSWFDRLHDDFALEHPDRTLLIEAAYRGRVRRPRAAPHVRCAEILTLAPALLGRVARPRQRDDAAMAARLVALVRERLPVRLGAPTLDQVRDRLLAAGRQLPFRRALYRRVFDRVRPRLLFVQGGSYGGQGDVLTWAREAGVTTAEFQHGLITRSHLAYNYGEAWSRDPARARQLPQHLLVYGRYWVDQVRTPGRAVVVGWPHLAACMAGQRAAARAADPCVLVVSQGHVTGRMVALTEALSSRLPGRRIVFRLHPGEVPFRDRYARLARCPNVSVSDRGDIYRCFAEAGAVVGHSSTALVEAVALGLPTFVLDDESSRLYVPAGLGTRVADADALAAALEAAPAPAGWDEAFAAADWRAGYRAFVERFVR